MSHEPADEFISKLKSDPDFCKRAMDIAQAAGFLLTFKEMMIRKSECFFGHEGNAHRLSSGASGGSAPSRYVSGPDGYEHWVG
ncbi:MAG: hypothetical protein ACOYLR_02940 [Chlorobium sp.]